MNGTIMEKLKLHTPDLTKGNFDKLAELFPHCITEAADEKGKPERRIDFDLLRQELSDRIVEGPVERYQLSWPGKREALLAANAPIAKTLRPCHQESVDFDTTRNLFIEGDNLDALKLLQETYLEKVKLIYIDPPYNRKKGNNLVYRDDFVGDTFEHLVSSSQMDEEGNKLVLNSDSNGRFHSDWLSMMYKRLRLCKNILANNGVVFISIDDNETANIRRMCDEIFGEVNFVGTIIWKNATDNNPTNIAVEHESIHVYAKSREELEGVWKTSVSATKDALVKIGNDLISQHKDVQELRSAYSSWFRENKNQLGELDRYKYIDFGGVYTGSQSVHNPGKEGYRYDVLHPKTKKPCKEPLMGYRFPKETMEKLLAEKRILFGDDHNKIIELKVYAHEYEDKLSSVFDLDGRTGPYDLKSLFPEARKVFSNPKPVQLIERLVAFSTSNKDICVDLFAGSSTLAHAVMLLNLEDNGNRSFISIQYPEEIKPDNKDSKDIFNFCQKSGISPYISEISKERIRRAGRSVKEQSKTVDIGFRVLKIDSSNMREVYYTPDAVRQGELDLYIDNVKADRSPEDLLFHVLLDWGVDLTLPITREALNGKSVYFVDGNALAACFDSGVTEELVKQIAARKPLRAVFRDAGFSDNSVKINVEQIFKLMSPTTDVKVI
ncbi:adenine-specific DNA-methyltransferase [Azospirillum agricola]|uniref:site-specific DNA-methyltransferase n=1 Tax=Azospirillum agricola TaxID=1720247 RepID=UPI001AE76213|nr:site-specific DNA-methyltransferase [Azospirillum agricola]MBP2231741.1 adenine-specific DNA-methyltransferase [Azospirillum agricola]